MFLSSLLHLVTLGLKFFYRAVDGWANTCGVFICIITVFFISKVLPFQ